MYGFSPEAKALLFSFLANLRHKVNFNSMFSDCEIDSQCATRNCFRTTHFPFYVNYFSTNINTTEEVIQFADDTSIFCCWQKSSLHGKVKEISQKTEEYVEMKY